jgi:hypothetical protein
VLDTRFPVISIRLVHRRRFLIIVSIILSFHRDSFYPLSLSACFSVKLAQTIYRKNSAASAVVALPRSGTTCRGVERIVNEVD